MLIGNGERPCEHASGGLEAAHRAIHRRLYGYDKIDLPALTPPALPAQPLGLVSICTSTVRYGIEEYIKPQQNSVKLFYYLLL